MVKDRRYTDVKELIQSGHIKTFGRIFDFIPKTVVYTDMGMNYNRFQKLFFDPELYTIRELKAMAMLIGCDPKTLIDLAAGFSR
ncbi:MAG: hypothetical protein P4L51_10805 [Puia sp.]|nr:hypothetical protein [Puia sp.]